MSDEIPRDRHQFERSLSALKRSIQNGRQNPGSHGCTDCERCYHCMFTEKSRDCFFCTYCRDCSECSRCTQCVDCHNCHDASYCVRSKNCSDSSYLILSENCAECVFCFGCVGLVKEEFHILNQKFSRQEYFEIVAELKEAFGIEDGV